MALELFVLFPSGEERRIYEAGAISTIQREARHFNREHPENTTLVFRAYEILDQRKNLVLVGTPRSGSSLTWASPEVQDEALTKVRVARVGTKRIIRDRVTG